MGTAYNEQPESRRMAIVPRPPAAVDGEHDRLESIEYDTGLGIFDKAFICVGIAAVIVCTGMLIYDAVRDRS